MFCEIFEAIYYLNFIHLEHNLSIAGKYYPINYNHENIITIFGDVFAFEQKLFVFTNINISFI